MPEPADPVHIEGKYRADLSYLLGKVEWLNNNFEASSITMLRRHISETLQWLKDEVDAQWLSKPE